MEFVTSALEGLGMAAAGVASGGILSLVGAAVKGFGAYMKRKQEAEQRKLEWEQELELERLRQSGKNQDAESELAIAKSSGSWRGLEASHKSVIAASAVHKWVNDIRSLFRPFLTVALLIMVQYMFNQLMKVLQGQEAALSAAFSPDQAGEIIRYIVYSIVYSATTAVTWWYGDRALTPSAVKGR